MIDRGYQNIENEQSQPAVISEKVVNIRRVAKVVKGGRHLSFSALVVVGDGQGRVGSGLGKAVAIPDAVRKGVTIGQKNLITVPLKGTTIPHVVKAKYGAAIVLLKPAPPGTGLIAGASVRAVLDMLGAKDIVTKSLKSQNPINVVRATLEALKQFGNSPENGVLSQGDATPVVENEAPSNG
jgi:small subunit ribosomal protein S5